MSQALTKYRPSEMRYSALDKSSFLAEKVDAGFLSVSGATEAMSIECHHPLGWCLDLGDCGDCGWQDEELSA